MCAFGLQGNHGGMTTMSNMTHQVSREEDGLQLTCEAFNKGTHFSKTQVTKVSVYCKWAYIWFISCFTIQLELAGVVMLNGEKC